MKTPPKKLSVVVVLLAMLALVGLWLSPTGCRSGRFGTRTGHGAVARVFQPVKLTEIDSEILEAITNRRCPGAVLWLERNGVAYCRAYGQRAVVPAAEPMSLDTVFDAASLTKVLATTPAVMLLVERGKVKLDERAQHYLPEFTGDGRENITVQQLLTHTSGLRPDVSLQSDWSGMEAFMQLAVTEPLTAQPAERVIYSDTGMILAGEIVRRVSGQPLDRFLTREVYEPLRMRDTGFCPPRALHGRVAPTEVEEGVPLRGVVHDPRARRMGGVAGHAGLFTTAADVARFARMMLGAGQLEGRRVFRPETIALMTSVQTPERIGARRGLGWDIDSSYSSQRGTVFPLGGYGHTGWTGTSLWIDPFSRTFVILLSNRNHPDESGSVIALRRRVSTLAAESVIGFNFAYVPGALPVRADTRGARTAGVDAPQQEVLNGIDVLVKQGFAPLKGLRVGLITNHTGHDRNRQSTVDLLHRAQGVELKALFSPEHGLRGTLDEKVGDTADEKTGLPVHSLYGETRQPRPDHLRDLDALVFDIQDIGCRFYTYISTMGLAMEAAAKANIKFFVLDRVNPIGGVTVDGPVHNGPSTFTAFHSIPVQHGMTVGELARLFNAERGAPCSLTVIPIENWRRDLWFDQTRLPWTNPSPNMRSLTEAAFYPGVGLLETTALSVGRGTGTPFELVGAPYIDDTRLAAELNKAGLAGVRFVPVRFTPDASVFKNQPCAGVQILLTDRDQCEPIDIGLLVARTLHRLYPRQFNIDKFLNLLTDKATLDMVRAGRSLTQIRSAWAADLAKFNQRRAAVLLYK